MYSDSFDKTKVAVLTSGTGVSVEGWKSIALNFKQPGSSMVTDDLVIEVSDVVDGTYVALTNQEVKNIVKNEVNNNYDVVNGLSLSDTEKAANASFKRLVLNTAGFKFLKVTGSFASILLVLTKPEKDMPYLGA